MTLDYAEKNDSVLGWMADEFLSGRFVKNFFDWIAAVIQTADTSLVLLILVILPLIVPATPAIVTYGNLQTGMHFTPESALIGGITIELLGYAGALLLLQFATDWMKKKKNAGWMTLVAGLSYLFYLVSVVSINVLLDKEAGRSSTYIWVIALLCLLSVPSGMLSATRIMSRTEKAEDEENRKQSLSLAEREAELNFERKKFIDEREHAHKMEMARLESEERIEKAKLRAQRSSGSQLQNSNKSFNLEADSASKKSESLQSSLGEGKKLKFVEATANFIEAFLKQNRTMPKLTDITKNLGGSESNAYYAVVEYIVNNGEALVSSGIVSREKLGRAIVAWDKKNKNKKQSLSEE